MLWAKVDVDMPTDGKLLGQPVVTRHLWTSLICLAKRQDNDGAISGYDCSLLAGAFNLPRKGVAAALTYFQAARMVELDADGKIRLLNFVKRQGHTDTAEAQALRQQKYYAEHREDILEKKRSSRLASSRVLTREDVRFPHAEVEEEVEKKEQDPPPSLKAATPAPLIADLESGWPSDLLARIRLAVMSTRKSGQMAEGPWREFLLGAKQFSQEIRSRAANEYLDRACASEGKGERYLLGIMRGERARLARPGSATLQITPAAKADHAIPGRKFL